MSQSPLKCGLCSVTFRGKSVEEVLALVKHAGLESIEWGGDVHVPPDLDPQRVREIRARTEDAGVTIASYGSYFHIIEGSSHNTHSWTQTMDVAELLGTSTLRLWCGGGDSCQADDALFREAADRAIEVAEAADKRHLTLAFEYHRGGLTDTAESTFKLLRCVDRPNLKTYYQTDGAPTSEAAVEDLKMLLPHLANLHCFYYPDGQRCLLEEGRDFWTPIVQYLKEAGHACHLLLEFVKDDAEESFLRDAAALRELVKP